MVISRPTKGFIAISINSSKVDSMFKNLDKGIPELPKEVMKEFGKTLKRGLKLSLTSQGLRDTSYLWSHIKWLQKKDRGQLTIPIYGAALDHMKPHWVKFSRGRTRLRGWGIRHGFGDRVARQGSIFVRPHPWIQAPMNRAISRIPQISKKVLERTIRGAA